ncbi:DapH/DapD/GlmU-related protein [Shewanella sp. ENK2]|uniref:DapH/DapD/GlmU-related protein n=1 Tax=Shewanella sp. ENK2 TaxID=2775245 RepID=UPI00374A7204
MTYRSIDMKSVSDILGVDFIGPNVVVNGLNLANRELNGFNLSYIGHENYLEFIDQEEIVAVFISKQHFEFLDSKVKGNKTFFIVDNPEEQFYKLHAFLYEKTDFYTAPLVSECGDNVVIHPTAVVEEGVIIQDNVLIGANVVIHKGTVIGHNVVIHAGAVIGTQGLQVLYNGEVPYLVQHVGGVKIGDNVSVGANACIANSLFDGYTEIGKSTKIDALVFIAHNCRVGKNCVLTTGVVMAGSSSLDDGVWLAPNSVILNRINVGQESLVCSHSLVMRNVPENTKVIGVPAKRVGRTIAK